MKLVRRLLLVNLLPTLLLQFAGVLPTAMADKSLEQPYPISSSLPLGVQTYLRMETSSDVFNVEYHYGRVTPAANGAFSQNIGSSPSSWYIEDQRYGQVDVIAGVLHRDTPLLQTGLKMFDFGLYREAKNGSFPGSFGLFHGTAMFLAAAAPAMLVLKYWVREPYLSATLRSHISWEISRMRQAARYLANAWWSKPGHIDDGGKEERKFEGALAFEATGLLSGDKWLEQRGAVYAREGVAMTASDGVWTEHGETSLCCHDSTYQAIGLTYGVRYLAMLGSGTFYNSVRNSVELGERWEYSRTTASGTINRQGDDRTGPTCPEKDGSGKCKGVDYEAIYAALMRWGALAPDSTFVRRAYAVWLYYDKLTSGLKLPAPGLFVGPHTSMSVKQIKQGALFSVGGTRFLPVEPVKIYFGSTLVGQTIADQIGNFGGHSAVPAVHFTPPKNTKPGVYKVSAHGQFGTYRSANVSIT